jgi:hypothetical protein
MNRIVFRAIVFSGFASVAMLGGAGLARAQDAKEPYPNMAPVEQYMMERDAEIALARSAAPDSISKDAEVMVMSRHGYETAVKGKNGFVCMVERGWTAPADNPDFWNPKLRGPLCLNAAAVRSYMPQTIMKTNLILAGRTKAQMMEELSAALDRKELPQQERGAMSYMLSKDGYLGDGNGHWHPHLMFFLPIADAETWGANLPASPILALHDSLGRMVIFLVPVGKWSDGTPAEGSH